MSCSDNRPWLKTSDRVGRIGPGQMIQPDEHHVATLENAESGDLRDAIDTRTDPLASNRRVSSGLPSHSTYPAIPA
jgi:hypothetical protein